MRESLLVKRDGLFRYKRRLCHRYCQARKITGGQLKYQLRQMLARIEQLQRLGKLEREEGERDE
jgi:hypothetical protein